DKRTTRAHRTQNFFGVHDKRWGGKLHDHRARQANETAHKSLCLLHNRTMVQSNALRLPSRTRCIDGTKDILWLCNSKPSTLTVIGYNELLKANGCKIANMINLLPA